MSETLERMAAEFEHLLKPMRQVMSLDDEERLKAIHKVERWIPYPAGQKILTRIEELYTWPNKARMPNMLIVGPTNNGKTTLIDRFLKVSLQPYMVGDLRITPVLKIELGPKPTLSQCYTDILTALGAPHRASARLEVLQQQALTLLRRVETRMIIIDELHNIEYSNRQAQGQILAMLKYLGNQLQIPIVAVGTEKAWNALKSDPQMANRFEPFPLPRWRDGNQLLQLLASFGQLLPLQKPSRLADPAIGKLVLGLTDGSIGDISRLMETAAKHAIRGGAERITPEVLAGCGYVSLAQKRHEVEFMIDAA